MSVAQFIRERIKKADGELDRIAHQTMAEARTYEHYLLNLGRYRQLKSERDSLETTLKKMRAADDVPQAGNLDVEEDDETEMELPQAPRKLRRATPRAWGGR